MVYFQNPHRFKNPCLIPTGLDNKVFLKTRSGTVLSGLDSQSTGGEQGQETVIVLISAEKRVLNIPYTHLNKCTPLSIALP